MAIVLIDNAPSTARQIGHPRIFGFNNPHIVALLIFWNFHSLLDLAARRGPLDHHGKGAVVRDGVRSSPGDPSWQSDQLRSHCEAYWTT